MQSFQFGGNLVAGVLISGAQVRNGGWRSELQIYSFQIQNIQMGTISSHTSTTIKKGKNGVKGVISKAQTPPKAARCPCRVTAEVTLSPHLNLTEDVCRL